MEAQPTCLTASVASSSADDVELEGFEDRSSRTCDLGRRCPSAHPARQGHPHRLGELGAPRLAHAGSRTAAAPHSDTRGACSGWLGCGGHGPIQAPATDRNCGIPFPDRGFSELVRAFSTCPQLACRGRAQSRDPAFFGALKCAGGPTLAPVNRRTWVVGTVVGALALGGVAAVVVPRLWPDCGTDITESSAAKSTSPFLDAEQRAGAAGPRTGTRLGCGHAGRGLPPFGEVLGRGRVPLRAVGAGVGVRAGHRGAARGDNPDFTMLDDETAAVRRGASQVAHEAVDVRRERRRSYLVATHARRTTAPDLVRPWPPTPVGAGLVRGARRGSRA